MIENQMEFEKSSLHDGLHTDSVTSSVPSLSSKYQSPLIFEGIESINDAIAAEDIRRNDSKEGSPLTSENSGGSFGSRNSFASVSLDENSPKLNKTSKSSSPRTAAAASSSSGNGQSRRLSSAARKSRSIRRNKTQSQSQGSQQQKQQQLQHDAQSRRSPIAGEVLSYSYSNNSIDAQTRQSQSFTAGAGRSQLVLDLSDMLPSSSSFHSTYSTHSNSPSSLPCDFGSPVRSSFSDVDTKDNNNKGNTNAHTNGNTNNNGNVNGKSFSSVSTVDLDLGRAACCSFDSLGNDSLDIDNSISISNSHYMPTVLNAHSSNSAASHSLEDPSTSTSTPPLQLHPSTHTHTNRSLDISQAKHSNSNSKSANSSIPSSKISRAKSLDKKTLNISKRNIDFISSEMDQHQHAQLSIQRTNSSKSIDHATVNRSLDRNHPSCHSPWNKEGSIPGMRYSGPAAMESPTVHSQSQNQGQSHSQRSSNSKSFGFSSSRSSRSSSKAHSNSIERFGAAEGKLIGIYKDSFSPGVKPTSQMKSVIKEMGFDELAEYLTIIEFEDCVQSIRPREFVNLAWTKKDLKSLHPDLGGSCNLCRVIHCNNRRIAWIAREIVDYASYIGSTAEAIEYFLRTARSALERNNFNTVFQIVSALELSSIEHLKAGWSSVSFKKKQLFKKYQELCKPDLNHMKYRRALAKTKSQPKILCLQILLNDIISLEALGSWRSGGKVDISKAKTMRDIVGSYLRLSDSKRGIDICNFTPSYTVNVTIQKPSITTLAALKSGSSGTTIGNLNLHNSLLKAAAVQKSNPSISPRLQFSHQLSLEGDDNESNPCTSGITNNVLASDTIDSCDIRSTMSDEPASSRSFSASMSMSMNWPRLSFSSLKTASMEKGARQYSMDSEDSNTSYTPQLSSSSSSMLMSFSADCCVTRELFFAPLFTEERIVNHMLQECSSPMGTFIHASSSSSSSSSLSPSPSSGGSVYNLRPSTIEKRSMYSLPGILKKSLKSSKNNFVLNGNDEKLAILQHHIYCLSFDSDLDKLWKDSLFADEVENKRLFGKLSRAGLY